VIERLIVLEKLPRLFYPSSVAVIGASDNFDKLGYHVMKSLVEGNYQGQIYPINPRGGEIWGIRAYASLGDVPAEVELAVIAVPAEFVPRVLEECGSKGVKGVVLITAGFRELEDPAGAALQEEIRQVAAKWSLPIIGPNTFGFVNLHFPLNASFTSEFSFLEKGGVALVSQSGGFSHLCGFLSVDQKVGFSKIVGLGNRCNIDFPEMVDYLADDPDTQVIALYIEGMDDPHRLMDAAKKVKKPIIAYKAGRSERGDDASRFHTGSLAGNYWVYQQAFRQAGILQVGDSEELLDVAKALDNLPPLRGNRVAVLSSQAGPGMIACDVAEAQGLTLPSFTSSTQDRINELLPPLAIRTNPVDMGPAWYSPEAIVGIVAAVEEDSNIDGIIFLAMYASANLALVRTMRDYLKDRRLPRLQKPLIACFAAPPGIWWEDIRAMDKAGMVVLPTPERAARAMGALWRVRQLRPTEEG
jgi:acetyl-CoA synthetase (ADP-forming)